MKQTKQKTRTQVDTGFSLCFARFPMFKTSVARSGGRLVQAAASALVKQWKEEFDVLAGEQMETTAAAQEAAKLAAAANAPPPTLLQRVRHRRTAAQGHASLFLGLRFQLRKAKPLLPNASELCMHRSPGRSPHARS